MTRKSADFCISTAPTGPLQNFLSSKDTQTFELNQSIPYVVQFGYR